MSKKLTIEDIEIILSAMRTKKLEHSNRPAKWRLVYKKLERMKEELKSPHDRPEPLEHPEIIGEPTCPHCRAILPRYPGIHICKVRT